jgi:hypothetical protein
VEVRNYYQIVIKENSWRVRVNDWNRKADVEKLYKEELDYEDINLIELC